MPRRPLGYLFVGLVTGALPASLPAQEPSTQLGFEVGYTRARFQPGGPLDESRDGSLIAGFVSRRLAGPVAGQIELVFSRKGGGLSVEGPIGPVAGTVNLIYVEVPLLARLSLPLGAVRPVLLGGGSYALRIGCELQAEAPGTVTQEQCDAAATGLQLAGGDFSAIFGGGLEHTWRGSTVRLEVRRIIGLRGVLVGQEVKNRVWGVLLGITF